jgi:hypothetical protein
MDVRSHVKDSTEGHIKEKESNNNVGTSEELIENISSGD